MKTTKYLIIVIVLVAIGLGVSRLSSDQTPPPTSLATGTQAKLGDMSLTLEIADTEALREHGLSDRASLADNAGMLFVFDSPGYPQFWMKDTLLSLDLIWLDEDMCVIWITPNLTPDDYPNTHSSPSPVLYVLEINGGAAQMHNIKVGDQLELIPK